MIKLSIPCIPPSLNHAYMTIRKGKKSLRILTKEGRKFQKEARAYLAMEYPSELAKFEKNSTYLLFIRFHIACTNKTWPETAANRYKKLDASNRVKLLEDVIADVTAVDDSHNMVVIVEKRDLQEGQAPRSDIWAWDMEKEETPFSDALLDLQ